MQSTRERCACRVHSTSNAFVERTRQALRLSSAHDKQCACRVRSTIHACVRCLRQMYSGARQMAPIGMHLSSARYSESLIVSSAHTLILICGRNPHPTNQSWGWFPKNILEQVERISAYTNSDIKQTESHSHVPLHSARRIGTPLYRDISRWRELAI